eukprot:TRINITY_DN9692_c0_g1_i2.p1 TRINITY_DN9692_c0_g1~~TRINITY_DN9692_c0_g1_i2.p1  ORF type:complete len:796 (-),score=224.19 TRINITY_DN9692_c0_g1_i2:151-2538(-)
MASLPAAAGAPAALSSTAPVLPWRSSPPSLRGRVATSSTAAADFSGVAPAGASGGAAPALSAAAVDGLASPRSGAATTIAAGATALVLAASAGRRVYAARRPKSAAAAALKAAASRSVVALAAAAGPAAGEVEVATAPAATTAASGVATQEAVPAAAAAAASEQGEAAPSSEAPKEEEKPAPPSAKPLQIVKIDLETNRVVLGDEELAQLEESLRRTGCEKVAVVGVMGAFRTGKSFLLDLMLRYLSHAPTSSEDVASSSSQPSTTGAPAWATAGGSLKEGRVKDPKGSLAIDEAEPVRGFGWRPGMEKCTEGVWIWSEPFVREANGEKVALLLMDTQGAWDARMTQEQSATVFGLTTLITSRLVYNISKQIQQDKIDNLFYFVQFAQAALRSQERSVSGGQESSSKSVKPFQTLEFLVRDWPHYPDDCSVAEGRKMMEEHLGQYTDEQVAEQRQSVDALQQVFEQLDVWCLPHPSLKIETQGWDGDLKVIDQGFWQFLDAYMQRVFSPEKLKAKTTLGTALTVDTFGSVVREFCASFGTAAPQAKTFAEAMEASSSMAAKDIAMKLLQRSLERVRGKPLPMEEFEKVAEEVRAKVEAEFNEKAIFGSEEFIQLRRQEMKMEIDSQIARYRKDNERALEESLSGLSTVSLAAITAFGVDRVTDVTCDWWSQDCQDLSDGLTYFYLAVGAFVFVQLNTITNERGSLDANIAGMELVKTMMKTMSNATGWGKAPEKTQAPAEAEEPIAAETTAAAAQDSSPGAAMPAEPVVEAGKAAPAATSPAAQAEPASSVQGKP